ncbi:AAA family ATPase [Novosphingobium sp. G106]|nr:AAA family ATPase [Novosphingobium sp. G106]MBV1692468.1 AAA family ATPase [Novosphingobium sp. G106]
MISNEQMDKLTALANLMEVGRLAIVGDRKQLSAIEAGKSFAVMQARTGVTNYRHLPVNTNMRQQPR